MANVGNRSSMVAVVSTTTTTTPMMRSCKIAQKVTKLIYKYTCECDLSLKAYDMEKVKELKDKLCAMSGCIECQHASQFSTAHHSISKKWVLGHLVSNPWLYGIKDRFTSTKAGGGLTLLAKEQSKVPRQTTRILKVGAIDTDLLNTAMKTPSDDNEKTNKHSINV